MIGGSSAQPPVDARDRHVSELILRKVFGLSHALAVSSG